MSSRESALPGLDIKSFMMENSVCVSLTRSPFLSSVRLRGLSRNGPLSSSGSSGSSEAPMRRHSASTRAISSAGEKGLVT